MNITIHPDGTIVITDIEIKKPIVKDQEMMNKKERYMKYFYGTPNDFPFPDIMTCYKGN